MLTLVLGADSIQLSGAGTSLEEASNCQIVGRVRTSTKAKAVLTRCTIHSAEDGGHVDDGGQLVLDDCEVKNVKKTGRALVLVTGMIIRQALHR